MLSEEALQAASDLLWAHWQEGRTLAALPEGLRPASRAEGYAIQARLEQHSTTPPFGWKIAATSTAGQRHIGVDGPIAGRLLVERAHADGARLDLAGNAMRLVEPEFAFRLARSLPPRTRPYATDEVLDAVAGLHPALEVPDSRFDEPATVGAAQLIADNACGRDFVLGAATTADWRGADLATAKVRATVAGRPAGEGSGAAVLGDPRTALTWLVNELSGLGLTLAIGQVVTTGTCMTPLPVRPGEAVEADFGPFGRVTLRLMEPAA
jgi:2-keto-4-pentenoate hydratase